MFWYRIKMFPMRCFRILLYKALDLDYDDVQTIKAKLGMPCEPEYAAWEETERRKKSNDDAQ